MRGRAKERGFTISEMLTAVAVVGIGLSLAAPGLQTLARDNRQSLAVNQFVTTLHRARSEAITRNATVTVCASRDGEHCSQDHWELGWIAFLDDDTNGQRSVDEPLLDRVAGLPGQELTSAQFPHAFSYRANGRAMGRTAEESSGEFAFCAPQAAVAARVLILRANGQPVLSDRGRDGDPARCRDS